MMRLNQYLSESTEKVLAICVGAPGTGKSTYINQHFKGYTVVSNDHIIEEYAKEHHMNYSEAYNELDSKTVKKEFNRRLQDAIKHKTRIVIDNTNMSVKARRRVLQYFDDSWKKIAVVFHINRSELDKRLDTRHKETGKHIPSNVVDRMLESFQMPTEQEGFIEVIKA